MKEANNTQLIVSYDVNCNPIYNTSKIKYNEHIGSISYDFENCRFVITWEDGSIRELTSEFALCCKVIDKE